MTRSPLGTERIGFRLFRVENICLSLSCHSCACLTKTAWPIWKYISFLWHSNIFSFHSNRSFLHSFILRRLPKFNLFLFNSSTDRTDIVCSPYHTASAVVFVSQKRLIERNSHFRPFRFYSIDGMPVFTPCPNTHSSDGGDSDSVVQQVIFFPGHGG